MSHFEAQMAEVVDNLDYIKKQYLNVAPDMTIITEYVFAVPNNRGHLMSLQAYSGDNKSIIIWGVTTYDNRRTIQLL